MKNVEGNQVMPAETLNWGSIVKPGVLGLKYTQYTTLENTVKVSKTSSLLERQTGFGNGLENCG